jgi:hypothetical protein
VKDNEAAGIVRFRDLKEPTDEHMGILFGDGKILCLCCGGWVPLGEYEIIEDYNGFEYVEESLMEALR